MKIESFIKTSRSITLHFDNGEVVAISKKDKRYKKVSKALDEDDIEKASLAASCKTKIKVATKGKFKLDKGVIKIGRRRLPEALSKKLLEMVEKGEESETMTGKKAREVLKGAVLKRLVEGKESAEESKQLATIVTDVPLSFEVEECEVRKYDKEMVVGMFQELGFRSLISMLPNDEFEEEVQEALF